MEEKTIEREIQKEFVHPNSRSHIPLRPSSRPTTQKGLLRDDLIPDESDLVAEAIHRLPPSQQAQRLFRFRRAFAASVAQKELDSSEWTTEEQVIPIIRYGF